MTGASIRPVLKLVMTPTRMEVGSIAGEIGQYNTNVIQLSHHRVRKLKEDKERDSVEDLADSFGIDMPLRAEFRKVIEAAAADFSKTHALSTLPEKPVREYVARESIIDYLCADEGFGPWWKAGVLTRPLIREKSPKAYQALNNWLRKNELPEGLSIPTKSETVTARLEAVAGQPISPEKRALAASLERGLRHALR